MASYAPHEPQQAAVGSYTPQAHRLPPLGYQASQYATQQSQVPMTANGEYSSNYITAGAFPSSPYQQSHQQVYGQRKWHVFEIEGLPGANEPQLTVAHPIRVADSGWFGE